MQNGQTLEITMEIKVQRNATPMYVYDETQQHDLKAKNILRGSIRKCTQDVHMYAFILCGWLRR
jgi:hypothetical protein